MTITASETLSSKHLYWCHLSSLHLGECELATVLEVYTFCQENSKTDQANNLACDNLLLSDQMILLWYIDIK